MSTDTLTGPKTVSGKDEQSLPTAPPSLRRREIVGLLALVAIAGVVAWLAIPSQAPKLNLPGDVSSHQSALFAGATLSPVNSTPPLSLRDYLGDPVNVRDYRGRAVFVTFLYTHCADVCPLIAANLHDALLRMPASQAARLEIIAVSVDPRGDNRQAVATFLHLHDMTGRMKYLIGSQAELARVWAAWNVGSERESANPAAVAHSALVYGVSASGKLRTVYQANFNPADIVRDAAKLTTE